MKTIRGIPALLAIASAVPAAAADMRCARVPNTDTHFPPPVFRSLSDWEARRAVLRKQILVSAGLYPMPKREHIKAEVFARLDRDGYSIEKVLIETLPGYYLGGNLYRPRGKTGKFPAVLVPHGHWEYGRVENQQLNSTPRQGITMAKQGYVVLAYDMVGYNDTVQTPHSFGGAREQLWNFGPLQLQLWNSIRALDFVTSLADVDASRVGITGASGGGTQTFLLTAIDDRIRFAAPVNMVSAIMQGGCVCENAPGLRIGTSNVEIAALAAPRPMILISGPQDWTKNVPQEEFPAIRSIYDLYGKSDAVANAVVDAPHNYNRESREHVYRFFGKYVLGLDNSPSFKEDEDIEIEKLQDMLVLHGRALPAGALTYDQLFELWRRRATERVTAQEDVAVLRELLRFTLHAEFPASVDSRQSADHLILSRKDGGDEIPAVYIPGRGTPAILVHPSGITAARESSAFNKLRESGRPVLLIAAFQTGTAVAPRDKSATHFLAFNVTDDSARVQDILTAAAYLRKDAKGPVEIIGVETAGIWALFAAALSPPDVLHTPNLGGFASTDDEYTSKFFVPGIQAAGGTAAALRLLSARRG